MKWNLWTKIYSADVSQKWKWHLTTYVTIILVLCDFCISNNKSYAACGFSDRMSTKFLSRWYIDKQHWFRIFYFLIFASIFNKILEKWKKFVIKYLMVFILHSKSCNLSWATNLDQFYFCVGFEFRPNMFIDISASLAKICLKKRIPSKDRSSRYLYLYSRVNRNNTFF